MIFFRVDANERIGTGHVIRCLSIAHAFTELKEDVVFITADHKADGLISEFRTICLNTSWDDLESELGIFTKLIEECQPALVVVDSYFVNATYFNVLRHIVKICYLDDMNASYWNVDCLINYNIFAEKLDYSFYKQDNKKLILMPQYAPLRDEFQNLSSYNVRQKVTDVLISAGGADPEGITEKIMDEICPVLESITFHFVVGMLNPRIDQIKTKRRKNVILHINEQNMSDLMRKCDIAVAAAGSTLYELCACGIPTITYTLADNQKIAADIFNQYGIMVNAGDCRNNDMFISNISIYLSELIDDYEKRAAISHTMKALVDGKGAMRIAEELVALL